MAVWKRLHKMRCGFIVYGRCFFDTTAERLGQVVQGEEITVCILFHTFIPFNYVKKHVRDSCQHWAKTVVMYHCAMFYSSAKKAEAKI